MKRVILYMSTLGLCIFMQAIQIIDDHLIKGSLPLDFIQQSEYFQGILSNPSYKQPLQVPLGISTKNLTEFHEQLNSQYVDASLDQLTQYYVIANGLLFPESVQKEILSNIYNQLEQLPDNLRKSQIKKLNTEALLQNLLAFSADNFNEEFSTYLNNRIDATKFQQKIQALVQNKYPEVLAYNKLVFALPLPEPFDPEKAILITNDTKNKLVFHENTYLPSMSIEQLELILSRNQLFDWHSIYLCAANTKNDRLYINRDKLFVFYNVNRNRSRNTTMKLSTLFPPNNLCTQAAFAPHTTKVTLSNNGICYILDYESGSIAKIIVPHKIYSGIMLSNNHVLYRTFDRKTYVYNLENQQSIPVESTIDYYILAESEANGFRIYGIESQGKRAVEKSELIQL